MDKKKVKLTLIYLGLFAFVGFAGLVLIVNAFANRDHRLYIPVLILGIMCFVASIYYGYLGISTLKDGLIGEKKKKLVDSKAGSLE